MSDYISSSVDQIRFSIVGAFASIIGLLFARIETSRKTYSQIRNEREKQEHSVIKNKKLYFFFVLAGVVSANGLFVPETPNVLPLAAVATVVFIVWTARFFARLFGNNDRTLFYLVFASAYTFYLAAGITNDLFKVTKSEFGLYQASLNWKDRPEKSIQESLLLGSNDNYLFLWNKGDDVAYVVERSAISHMQIRDRIFADKP